MSVCFLPLCTHFHNLSLFSSKQKRNKLHLPVLLVLSPFFGGNGSDTATRHGYFRAILAPPFTVRREHKRKDKHKHKKKYVFVLASSRFTRTFSCDCAYACLIRMNQHLDWSWRHQGRRHLNKIASSSSFSSWQHEADWEPYAEETGDKRPRNGNQYWSATAAGAKTTGFF